MPRLFDFQGTDSDYIKFLESKLLEAKIIPSSSTHLNPRRSKSTLAPLKESSKFQFVICKPKLNQIPRSPQPPTLPKWRKLLYDFIGSIPVGEEKWKAARCDAGIYTMKSNRQAIQLMLGRETESIFPSQNQLSAQAPIIQPADNEQLISRACKYGKFISAFAGGGNFALRVAEYQKLIFTSYCIVLLKAGNTKETIYSMMREYINKNFDDKTLERYRSGALWVNQCIATLLRYGWGHRSWEIFLLREF
jgi:hypothetical protein